MRPMVVARRTRIGDWEGDHITGRVSYGYIATLVERRSSYLAAARILNRRSETLTLAVLEAYGAIPNSLIHTITLDNGPEFYQFAHLDEALKCKIFFADPYSAWQRGANENTNGLLRQIFPRKTSFKDLCQNHIDSVVDMLNHRPRKRLGYHTPHEVFHNLPVAVLN